MAGNQISRKRKRRSWINSNHVEKLLAHRTITNYGFEENGFLVIKRVLSRLRYLESRTNCHYHTFHGSFPLLVTAKYGSSPRVQLFNWRFPAFFCVCAAFISSSILPLEYGHTSTFSCFLIKLYAIRAAPHQFNSFRLSGGLIFHKYKHK